MLHISALEKLVHELSRLPGIGPKTAQRLAYFILKKVPQGYGDQLAEALGRVRAEVRTCPICFNFTDQEICRFCVDPHRHNDLLCIVEEPADIMRIELSGSFRGRYHVLHGVLSPLEGITPEQLRIRELIERIQSWDFQVPLKEIIMALDADLEGDTTVLYISKVLQDEGILNKDEQQRTLKISRIAHGIPIGSDIDYIDERTMSRALENRVEV